jgi:nucleoside-triphosphatase THEP1
VELLVDAGVTVGGFVTHEVLGDDGRRVGFTVRDLAGPRAWLAHQDFDTGIRVGRFGVDIAAFEHVGLVALEKATRLARDQVKCSRNGTTNPPKPTSPQVTGPTMRSSG